MDKLITSWKVLWNSVDDILFSSQNQISVVVFISTDKSGC